MHARVVDLRVQPVDTKEVIRIYRDSVVPAAKRQPGFRGALLLTDPDTGIGISVTMWESEADREAGEASGYYKEQIEKFSAYLTETPVRKHYDVSVLVQARGAAPVIKEGEWGSLVPGGGEDRTRGS